MNKLFMCFAYTFEFSVCFVNFFFFFGCCLMIMPIHVIEVRIVWIVVVAWPEAKQSFPVRFPQSNIAFLYMVRVRAMLFQRMRSQSRKFGFCLMIT